MFLLTLLVSFVFPWLGEKEAGRSTSALSLTFDEINQGLDPRGYPFDISEIKSDAILVEAVSRAGVSLTAQQVRASLVTEVLTSGNLLSSMLNLPSVTGKVESVNEQEYRTGEYIISIRDGILPRPVRDAALLNSVMKTYADSFKSDYLLGSETNVVYSKEEMLSFDYPEIVDLLKQEAASLGRYASSFEKADSDLVPAPEETELSFSDLRAKVQAIQDIDIENIKSLVNYYALSKDVQARISYETVKLRRGNVQLRKSGGRESAVQQMVDMYKNNSSYIINSNTTNSTTNSREDAFYSNLMNSLVTNRNDTVNDKRNVDALEGRIAALQYPAFTQEEQSQRAKEAEDLIGAAYDKIDALRKEIRLRAERNYDTNIGNKIKFSRSVYSFNTFGNPLLNFLIILFAAVVFRALHFNLKERRIYEKMWLTLKDLLRKALESLYLKKRETHS
jgi:hypothetical protein